MSDKRVSDMSDAEIRAMAGAPDPVAAELAAIRDRQEHGDLRDFATHDSPRLLAGYDDLLKLHVKADKPARYYDHCPAHAFDPDTRSFGSFGTVRDCPDCTYTEHWLCKHCECPNDEWPCPTYRAISAALLGKGDTGG